MSNAKSLGKQLMRFSEAVNVFQISNIFLSWDSLRLSGDIGINKQHNFSIYFHNEISYSYKESDLQMIDDKEYPQ